jgi:hypothetical protein
MESKRFASIRSQRILIWISLVAATVYGSALFGLMGFLPPPHADLSADQVLALYSEHNVRFLVGCIIALISGFFLLPWSTVLACQMARLEKGFPIWTAIQWMGINLIAIFIWGPPIIWGTAAFSVDRAPELTLLLHELGFISFITPLTVFPIALVAVLVICFTKDEADNVSAFPRWIGYLTAWQAVQSFGGPVALLFKSGIFSWSGLIPFWLPFLLFSAWFGAQSWTMLRALKHQEAAGL